MQTAHRAVQHDGRGFATRLGIDRSQRPPTLKPYRAARSTLHAPTFLGAARAIHSSTTLSSTVSGNAPFSRMTA